MTDAITTLRDEARAILGEQKDEMRAVVRGLSAAALNWAPAGGAETNSIAQMLSHALEAERFLVAAAVDAEVDRDREAQFRVHLDDAADLLALIDRTQREVEGYLAQLTAERLAAEVARPNRTHTGSWWLLHAVEHSREHIGQALLTRQLYERD
jgi:hypothetical protein